MDRALPVQPERTRHVDRPSHSQDLRRPTRGQPAVSHTSLLGPRYR